ncbi:PadR family transcriptional regulator [Actinomyces provencensis]|uniref:PadR family transcriptional regulator n=1 Tax=Actinomyces provencensis TaxID=1720198 RepID=UPI00096A3689|nr:PadR family transcriptional regulator [Actinomyces provencensis]
MGIRAEMLELAILGELDCPTHGYELRRRLSDAVGPLRTLSFGSLYPALHRLERAGYITSTVTPATPGHRKLITHEITPAGQQYLAEELERVDSDDDSFAIAVGLMSKASPAARLRLLKDRRARVQERREERQRAQRRVERDPWRRARTQWEEEDTLREITWLDRLISMVQSPLPTDQSGAPLPGPVPATGTATGTGTGMAPALPDGISTPVPTTTPAPTGVPPTTPGGSPSSMTEEGTTPGLRRTRARRKSRKHRTHTEKDSQ